MATIIERKKKDGTPSFLVQIAIRKDGKQHREAKTLKTRREAQAWAKWREAELEDPAALIDVEDPFLSEVISRHENESKRLGRTKASVLRLLRDMPIAAMRCSEIRSQHIVSLARELAASRAPSTVSGYMTFLNGVFETARPAWGYPLDAQAMKDALVVIGRQGLSGRSQQRDRRPTREEMDRIMEFFAGRKADAIPMAKIAIFAMFSSRREAEITRLLWSDLDEAHGRILVRDAKDPRGSAGNHIWVELPPEAMAIIKTMPRTEERIFPFKPDSVCRIWAEATRMLGIEDLHFHDLRHEAVSRLFELGRTIPQAASVSGHRSWQNLQRYAHLRQTGDKWANWPWLEKTCPQEKKD